MGDIRIKWKRNVGNWGIDDKYQWKFGTGERPYLDNPQKLCEQIKTKYH